MRGSVPAAFETLATALAPVRPALFIGLCALPLGARAQEGDLICPTASSPLPTIERLELHQMQRSLAATGAFSIVLTPGPGLRAEPAALAAAERAAARWEALLDDPITVHIDIDLAPLGNGVIGSNRSELFSAPYDAIVSLMAIDAADEAADAIVAATPRLADFAPTLPAGVSFTERILVSKANLKALGIDLDASEGPLDATITLSSSRSDFDFDPRDGIAPGRIDFEGVVVHEIGHSLGFRSSVDDVDLGSAEAFAGPLDLFRFTAGQDPESPQDFARLPRRLQPGGDALFDDAAHEASLSTGISQGDGRQASHWKDDRLSGGIWVGVMDPTVSTGNRMDITAADRRAFDLIGYEARSAEELPLLRASGPLRAASGAPVRLSSFASDEDGLGFPIFAALGVPHRVRVLWRFDGASVLEEGSVFALDPLIAYTLPPGAPTRVFRPRVTAFDFLGDRSSAEVPVTVSHPPSVMLTANGQAGASISVRPDAPVSFEVTATDSDGLGFPIFSPLGFDAPIVQVWSFGDGQIPHPLLVFSPTPTATFAGTPGQSFEVTVLVFDAVGIATPRSVHVELVP